MSHNRRSSGCGNSLRARRHHPPIPWSSADGASRRHPSRENVQNHEDAHPESDALRRQM